MRIVLYKKARDAVCDKLTTVVGRLLTTLAAVEVARRSLFISLQNLGQSSRRKYITLTVGDDRIS